MMEKRWLNQIICILLILTLLNLTVHVYVSSSFFSRSAERNITSIRVENMQSYPTIGGEWMVTFHVEGTADLHISPIEGTSWSKDHCSQCDLLFLSISNETETFDVVWDDEQVVIKNFSSSTPVQERCLVQSLGKHALQFEFGDDVVYAYNDATDWWNSNWGYRKKLSINHSQVPGSLSNVPVLVNISDEDLNEKAKTDGSDIVFISYQDNTSKYHHEIENYTNGHLTAWVNVTEIFAATDTNLWMYYGNPSSEEQQNPTGVWDTDHVLVYHFNETDLHGTTFDVFDSTFYSNDATTQNMSENNQVPGKIDGSLTFNGTNNYINTTLPDNTITNTFTITYWFNASELDETRTHFSLGTGNDNERFRLDMFVNESNKINCYFGNDTSNTTLNSSEAISVDEWYFVTVSYNATHLTLYVNGTRVDSSEIEISLTKNDVMIGSDLIKSNFHKGQIDEVRFLTTARDQVWITTSYNTMNNQSDFITAGSEESAAPVVSNPFPLDGDNSVARPPSYFEITVFDPNPELLNITWRTNQSGKWKTFNVTNGSGSGVDDGTYQVTNTSWVTTYGLLYWWSVNVSDGTHWTNETYSFTMHQYTPVINSFILENITGQNMLKGTSGNLTVNQEYTFTINITDKNGWEDISFINLTAWYDDGSESSTYNQTRGANFNMFLQYENTSATSNESVFRLRWPHEEATLESYAEQQVNETTFLITFRFIPGNQTRCATSNESWDNTELNTFENAYSWNLNCTVTDSMNNKDFYQSEYGMNYYSALRAPSQVEIYGAPGLNAQSEIFTIDFISNSDYSLVIYFEENLTQVNGPDRIGIEGNLSVFRNANPSDNITFAGLGEDFSIVLNDSSSPADGLFESVEVIFDLFIPFGTWGRYSAQINNKINRV
jgi:hypothetical protein